MDLFLLKFGGQTEMIITLSYAILMLFLLFKYGNVEFFNCQDEQGTRQKTTHKNLKISLQKQISKGILCHWYAKSVVIVYPI